MSKDDERKKIVEAINKGNFEEEIQKEGFTVTYGAEENKSKKKANL